MAVKFACTAGARVILTSSSDEKLAAITSESVNGAGILTINYKQTPNWEEKVLQLTSGLGADIVIENGGTSSLVQSLRATKRRGVVSSVGYLGKGEPEALRELIPVLIERAIVLR
jgi:NADPH:quinone reductase-like Zn-dependent oxidoreductase